MTQEEEERPLLERDLSETEGGNMAIGSKEYLERVKKQVGKRKRAGELVGGRQFEVDEQVDIDDILDKDMYITDFDERSGSYGVWVIVLATDPDSGKVFSFGTGGAIVVRKLQELREQGNLPVLAQITKPGRYYDLV